MIDYTYSWMSVERGCFEYLNRVLGTIEGVQAFPMKDMPRTMPSDGTDFFIWEFSINGGAIPVQRQQRGNLELGAWQMDASFRAICTTDDVAMLVGGVLVNALPATSADNINGLARLYPTEFPSREKTTERVFNTDRAGDERIFFEVTLPLVAAFSNVERMT